MPCVQLNIFASIGARVNASSYRCTIDMFGCWYSINYINMVLPIGIPSNYINMVLPIGIPSNYINMVLLIGIPSTT